MPGIDIDPAPSPAFPRWRVLDFQYSNPTNILRVKAIDAFRNPLGGAYVWVATGETAEGLYTDRNGLADYKMLPGVSYAASIQDESSDEPFAHTETIRGLVLFTGYTVTFQRLTEPPPPPGNALEDAIRATAKSYAWLALNDDAALYKFGVAHNLGHPQTAELAMQWDGETYLLQVFHRGIVYAPQGKWEEVKIITKQEP